MSNIDLGSLEYDFLLNLSPFELATRKAQQQLEKLDRDTQMQLDGIERRSNLATERIVATNRAVATSMQASVLAEEKATLALKKREEVVERLSKQEQLLSEFLTQTINDQRKLVVDGVVSYKEAAAAIAESNKAWEKSVKSLERAQEEATLAEKTLTLATERSADARISAAVRVGAAEESEAAKHAARIKTESDAEYSRLRIAEQVAAATRRQMEEESRLEDGRTAAAARAEARMQRAAHAEATAAEARRRRGLAGVGTVSRNLALAGGIGIAGLGFAARTAGDWQQELARAQALTEDTAAQNRQAGQFARGLGNRTGLPAEEIVRQYTALRELGKTGKQAFDEITHAADAAIGRNEKLGDVITAVDGIMRAFGLDASESGHVTDILTKATEHTGLTMQQLETNLQAARVAAANMHISVQELVASFVQMIHHGSSATSVGNVFAQTMTRLSIPHPRLIAEAKALGVEWVANGHVIEHFAQVGFPNAIAELNKATKRSPALIEQLMGVRQGSGRSANMLTLFEGPIDGLKKITAQMMVTAGESKRTADIAMGAWNRQVDVLKENFRDFQRGIGLGLIGTLNRFLKWTDDTARSFNRLSDSTKSLIGQGAGALFGILGVMGAAGQAFLWITRVRTALEAWKLWRAASVVAEIATVTAAAEAAETAVAGVGAAGAATAAGVGGTAAIGAAGAGAAVAAPFVAAGALVGGIGLLIGRKMQSNAESSIQAAEAFTRSTNEIHAIQKVRRLNRVNQIGYTSTDQPYFMDRSSIPDEDQMIPIRMAAKRVGLTIRQPEDLLYLNDDARNRLAGSMHGHYLQGQRHLARSLPVLPVLPAGAPGRLPPASLGEKPLYAAGIGTGASQLPAQRRGAGGVGNRLDTGVLALDARIMAARSILDPTQRINAVTDLEEKRVRLQADLHIKQLRNLEAAGKATADATSQLIGETNASVQTQIAALETIKSNTLEKIHKRSLLLQQRQAAKEQRQADRGLGRVLSGQAQFYADKVKGLGIAAPTFEEAASPLDYASQVGLAASYAEEAARVHYRQNLLTLPLKDRRNEHSAAVQQFAATRDAAIEAAENKRAERLSLLEDKQTELDARQQRALLRQIDKAIQTSEYQLRFAPGLTSEQRVAKQGAFIRGQIGATYFDPQTKQVVGLKSQDDRDALAVRAQEEADRAAEMTRKKFVARGIADAKEKGKGFTGEKDRSLGSMAVSDALTAMLSDPVYAGHLDDDDIDAIRVDAARYADQAASEKSAYAENRATYIEGRQQDDLILQARMASGQRGRGFFKAGRVDPDNVLRASELVKTAQTKAEQDKKYGYSSPAYFADIRKQVDDLLKPTSIWEGLKEDADKKFKSISDSFAKAVGEMAAKGGSLKKWFQSVWEDIVSWFTEFVVQKLLAGIASIFAAKDGSNHGGGLIGSIQAAAAGLPGGGVGGGSGLLGSLSAVASITSAFSPHAIAMSGGAAGRSDLTQLSVPGGAGGTGFGLDSLAGVGGLLKSTGALGKLGGFGGILSKALPWLGIASIAIPLLGGLFKRHHKRLLFDDSSNDWQAGLSGRDFTTHFLAGVSREMAVQTAQTMTPQMPFLMRERLGRHMNARQMAFMADRNSMMGGNLSFNINQPTLMNRQMIAQLTDHVDRTLASKLVQRSGRGSYGGRDRQT